MKNKILCFALGSMLIACHKEPNTDLDIQGNNSNARITLDSKMNVLRSALEKVKGDEQIMRFSSNKEKFTWQDLDKAYNELSSKYEGRALEIARIKIIQLQFAHYGLLNVRDVDVQRV